MSWSFRRSEPPAPEAMTDADEPSPPPSEVHPSPGFADLVQHLQRTGGGLHILDLGPALGSNIEFLGRWARRLQIVDLPASLAEIDGVEQRLAKQPEAVFAETLPAAEPPGFDVVLAWNLFDYLDRRPLAALGDGLTRLSRPGGHLFAFVSTDREIPALPPVIRIEGEGRYLRGEPRTAELRPGRRWNPGDLEEALPGFEVVHSYLLRHGVREHLLRRRGAAPGTGR